MDYIFIDPANPSPRRTSFCSTTTSAERVTSVSSSSQRWERGERSLVSLMLTQKRERQVTIAQGSITHQEKAHITQQNQPGETWCVMACYMGRMRESRENIVRRIDGSIQELIKEEKSNSCINENHALKSWKKKLNRKFSDRSYALRAKTWHHQSCQQRAQRAGKPKLPVQCRT